MRKIKDQAGNSLRLFLVGFAMGAADVVPGVSGGTIAFIFGIFEELIYSIKKVSGNVVKLLLSLQIKKAISEVPFFFLVPLGIGIMTAFLSLSRIISQLLQSQPVFIWSFFFGLMVASIFIVRKRVVTWDPHDYFALAVASISAFLLTGIVPVETPETYFAFFVSGMIAICAMILPGVSGSFLLVMMGKYEQVLGALVNRDLLILGSVMVGAVVGLATFSRILNWLFQKHHDIIIASLTGFMIGSLRKVWPWKEVVTTRINSHGVEVPLQEVNYFPFLGPEVFWAILLMLMAAGLMFYLNKLHVTDEEVEVLEDPKYEALHKKALRSQLHKK